MSTSLALAYRAPVAKRARKDTLLKDGGSTEKFGPLKVVLGAIPALYANREVRLKLSTKASPLTNTLVDDHRYERQNQKPPLACGFFGRTFQFTSERRGRSEAP